MSSRLKGENHWHDCSFSLRLLVEYQICLKCIKLRLETGWWRISDRVGVGPEEKIGDDELYQQWLFWPEFVAGEVEPPDYCLLPNGWRSRANVSTPAVDRMMSGFLDPDVLGIYKFFYFRDRNLTENTSVRWCDLLLFFRFICLIPFFAEVYCVV